MNPFQVLETVPSLLIKQKPSFVEIATGIEMANKYNIHILYPSTDGKFNPGPKVYKVKEKGSCCMRQFGTCMATRFEVKDVVSKAIVMNLEKPCACGCVCCFRPKLIIYDGNNNYMGEVRSMCSFCNDWFDILDESHTVIGHIRGACCQWGRYCTLPMSPCDKIQFDIIDSSLTTEQGRILKVWSGFAKEILSDADNFQLHFPTGSSLKNRMLLLGAVFLIDNMFFENNHQDKETGGSTLA